MDNEKLLESVKLKLCVTWNDTLTRQKIETLIEDAEIALNHKLGAEIDYSKKGMERSLFLNYCLYQWNNCADEFDIKYKNEIYQIRKQYEVKNYVKTKVSSTK